MAGLPEVTVTGTLTADPELRFTASGVAVANFTVAANDRRFDAQSGTWVDGDATFLRCSVWRQVAENVAESLSKGARVLVTGQLRQRSYQTPEGDKRIVMELAVTEIGPSLKWATAKVAKATRTTGNSNGGGGRGVPEPDPWTTRPPSPAGQSDEPPF
jgi:single-strand DNA-binding protein